MTRLWIAHLLCFTMLNTCVLHLGEQFMESGVKCIRWQCQSEHSQACVLASDWSMFPSASSDWLTCPMCSSVWPCYCDPAWLQWHQLTPDTNCFHLSLQSYQESLTNTNWHVIPSMWEEWRRSGRSRVRITCWLSDSAVTTWQMPTRIFAIILSKLP